MTPAERLTAGILLVLLASPQGECFLGGIHLFRRGLFCREVHCRWGGWSSWGSCNHPCGNAGVATRSRGIARKMKCHGHSCSGPSLDARPCNRGCPHGGTAQNGYCSGCPRGFYGTCCEHGKSRFDFNRTPLVRRLRHGLPVSPLRGSGRITTVSWMCGLILTAAPVI